MSKTFLIPYIIREITVIRGLKKDAVGIPKNLRS